MMTTDGLVDGSWELTILVTDLQVERTLRVKGDLHVGGVMLKLVDALGMFWLLPNINYYILIIHGWIQGCNGANAPLINSSPLS